MNNQTNVTVVGHVATEPRLREVGTGAKVANFRLAATERRFDKALKEWRDGGTIFFTVTCWRGMAENVASSVKKGQPVIVEGRLHVSFYDDKDGATRTTIEIDASTVGHDLSRGVATFVKATGRAERELAAELCRDLDDEELPGYDSITGEIVDPEESGLVGRASRPVPVA